MRGAVPLPARAESPEDRLADLLAESATALSQDARSAARLAAEATALATAASDVGARARARYLEGRAAELALDETGALAAYREALAGFQATAEVTVRTRPGVVVAPSVWWRKLSPDGRNANAVTGQGLTDLGRGATFYDCLVEVSRSGARA